VQEVLPAVRDTPTERVVHNSVTRCLRQCATSSDPGRNDLFHARVDAGFVAEVWTVMAQTPQHTYQVLTKRPERLARVLAAVREAMEPDVWPLPNVWLGTSVESDSYVRRADHLRAAPAQIRFLSLEPLLGPLPSLSLAGIDWVIVGGESGRGHRPVDGYWVRDLRDRALKEGVAFFFKQWGGSTPKAGGRQLDGRTWDEMPVLRGPVAIRMATAAHIGSA
jgi:protein gp37